MIFLQLSQQLQSLSRLLLNLTDEQFTKKVAHLGNSSIGGHTRHVIELLQCAIDGYSTGEVDYVNRKRNLLLETDRMFALSVLQQQDGFIKVPDRKLNLVVEQIEGAVELTKVTTTYYREVVYNTEHTIHHLALIKVAIIDMKLDIVDNNFGMAYSTIKYQASVAQA
ncbi:MAG: DinB family protein [Rhizobacter sp.]|nr:DinB family protein [Ferruginibacter sp.]